MAGKIPQSFIDDLLERTDIVELIDARVKLKKTGSNYSALCPFHNEKTPSFSVNPDKQFYYCFGCGAGGNAISFLMDYERSDFVETIEKLAAHQGLNIPREENPLAYQQQQTRRTAYELMEKASTWYQQQLASHRTKQQAIDYLRQRGLSGEICKQFGIGYAPPGWDNLLKQLGTDTEQIRLLIETGMLISKDNDQGHYDRFRDRLMFPIIDNRGRVIAFGGRVLNDDKPKYLNSPETTIFHKQQELYGLYQARQANRHLQRLIMVEGYMDVVALAQFGINNAVATLGTSASSAHMEKVFRHSNEVVFCFDGDSAGIKAAERALEAVLPMMQPGKQARFLFLPEGEDPDSWVRQIGAEKFNWHVEKAASLSEHLFELHSRQLDLSRPDDRAQLISDMMPHLRMLPEGPLQSLIIRSLSEKTGLPVDELEALYTATKAMPAAALQAHSQAAPAPVQREKLSRDQRRVSRTPVRTAAALLMLHPDYAQLTPDLTPHFQQTSDDELLLLQQIHQYLLQNPGISTATVLGHWLGKAPDAIKRLLSLELPNEGPEQRQQEYLDAIQQAKKHLLYQKQQQWLEKLKANPHLHPQDMDESQREAFMAVFRQDDKKH